MEEETKNEAREPSDGDWCFVDLSDNIPERATNWAHAMGMDFEAFMCLALEEKMARLAEDAELKSKMEQVQWIAPLSMKNLSSVTRELLETGRFPPPNAYVRPKAE